MTQIVQTPSARAAWWMARERVILKARHILVDVANYILLVILTLIFTGPLIWMVSTSFKPEGYAFEYPPRLFTGVLQWWNYTKAWGQFTFWQSLGNTMTITVGVLVGRLLSGSLTAYAFARLRAPGRNLLFIVVLSTMMIPHQVTLIPQFILFRNMGWLDSMKPLIWPAWFGGGAYFIFLLRQFFMTIPQDYDDAARIDGCGSLGILWRIILPMSLPALGTVSILTFMGCWNDFFGPLIYLNRPEKQTLALAIRQWQYWADANEGFTPPKYVEIMAMCTILTIPPVLVYFFAQRYFVQGIVVSGVKG